MSDTLKPKIWTVRSILAWTKALFLEKGLECAALDAQVLLAYALGVKRLDLFLRYDQPLNAQELKVFKGLIVRRVRERCPVAYLTGEREFWSLPLGVCPDVLIPRPETESVVEAAVGFIRTRLVQLERRQRVVDVCTGSGAIGLALASEFGAQQLEIWATDISEGAIKQAQQNASALGFSDIHFIHTDLLEGIDFEVDIIVCNPPYVSHEEMSGLAAELSHEPVIALDGGVDGLAYYRRLAPGARNIIAQGGAVLVEIGFSQARAVCEIFTASGFGQISVGKDFAGLDRYVMALG